jgi:hypothetical protein
MSEKLRLPAEQELCAELEALAAGDSLHRRPAGRSRRGLS